MSTSNTTNSNTNTHSTLPDIEAKWGRGVRSDSAPKGTSESSKDDKPDFSTYYTTEEQGKLRAQGVNPTLKAEMEWSKHRSQGKGIWGKVAGTAMGGGWIK